MIEKDYKKIAQVIKMQYTSMYEGSFQSMVTDFVDMLQEDNKDFNRETFINYINKL